jgi:hypothetical protein
MCRQQSQENSRYCVSGIIFIQDMGNRQEILFDFKGMIF